MKIVTGSNGKTYRWNPRGRKGGLSSAPHAALRSLLSRMFPGAAALEEVLLPGSGRLRLDFLIPSLWLAAEAHGEQHYGFVRHFHENIVSWHAQRARDAAKREWCEKNGLALAELHHARPEEWAGELARALGGRHGPAGAVPR